MHSQRDSKLLSAPIEIRFAVYANIIPDRIHVFFSEGKLHMLACLQPSLGDDATTATSTEVATTTRHRIPDGPIVCAPLGGRIGNVRKLPRRKTAPAHANIVAIVSLILFFHERRCKGPDSIPNLVVTESILLLAGSSMSATSWPR